MLRRYINVVSKLIIGEYSYGNFPSLKTAPFTSYSDCKDSNMNMDDVIFMDVMILSVIFDSLFY